LLRHRGERWPRVGRSVRPANRRLIGHATALTLSSAADRPAPGVGAALRLPTDVANSFSPSPVRGGTIERPPVRSAAMVRWRRRASSARYGVGATALTLRRLELAGWSSGGIGLVARGHRWRAPHALHRGEDNAARRRSTIGFLPLPVDPIQMAMACFLRSAGITPASSLLQSSPPLTGASVLSASRLAPLAPFPLASPCRFSRSIQEPGRASRRLYAGCRSGRLRHPPS
jgi:hypothetical protein